MPGVPQFTFLTSTYNRAHAIHRVYDSLRGQTLHDFEWLAVDEAHGQLLVPLDSDDACVPQAANTWPPRALVSFTLPIWVLFQVLFNAVDKVRADARARK
jgi:hypothetical protein